MVDVAVIMINYNASSDGWVLLWFQLEMMIGDNLKADIGGARNFGMDQVFFNPKRMAHTQQVTYEIEGLRELKNLL